MIKSIIKLRRVRKGQKDGEEKMDRRRRHGSWIAGKKKNEARKSKRERERQQYLLDTGILLHPRSLLLRSSGYEHHQHHFLPWNILDTREWND